MAGDDWPGLAGLLFQRIRSTLNSIAMGRWSPPPKLMAISGPRTGKMPSIWADRSDAPSPPNSTTCPVVLTNAIGVIRPVRSSNTRSNHCWRMRRVPASGKSRYTAVMFPRAVGAVA